MEGSDYINASFIDVSIVQNVQNALTTISLPQGYPNKKKSYIASQGDLKMHSDCVSHFVCI